MPNWVWNTLTVSGEAHELNKFVEQAKRGYRTKAMSFGQDGMEYVDTEVSEELSFWNFIRPDESILSEYHGAEPRPESIEQAMKHASNHWYDWNIRNWGTKWDACDVQRSDEGDAVTYTFDTAWSPPEPVFRAMVEQFPKLSFEYRYLEEQGWGGELAGNGGIYWIVDEWDIPLSHEERVEHIGYCYCEEMRDDETEYMYEDCPKRKELANA